MTRLLLIAALTVLAAGPVRAGPHTRNTSIVLVHGAFVDGSGWKAVYDILSEAGYEVLVVQHGSATLEDDVAATTDVIDRATYPVVLVGHSYGGMIISEAGRHANVRALVYVAAYAPASGESVATLAQVQALPGESRAPVLPPRSGRRIVDPEKFPTSFAADVPLSVTRFMAASQVPWGIAAAQAPVAEPAWKAKPASYLVATEDHMIPPSLQRMMAKRSGAKTVELASSHAVMLSHPREVAAFITESIRDPSPRPGAKP